MVDTVTRWQLLRALRVTVEAALEEAFAMTKGTAPTPERALAVSEAVASRIEPAFLRALAAGISDDDCWDALGPEGAAIKGLRVTLEAELRREEAEAGERLARAKAEAVRARLPSAHPVDALARLQAVRGLRVAAEPARAGTFRSGTTVVIALRDAVKAGVPVDVALEVAERQGVRVTPDVGAALTNSREHAANAEARLRAPIELPAPVQDHTDSTVAAAGADAHLPPASPTPEPPLPVAAESEGDLRSIDEAAAVLGATFSEPERRIAARLVSQVRMLAGRMAARAERHRRALGRVRILRRPRASRAPYRAARRAAVAPARDGPPPSDDAPTPPVASRALRGAAGSFRRPAHRPPFAVRSDAPAREPGIVIGRAPPLDVNAEAAVLSPLPPLDRVVDVLKLDHFYNNAKALAQLERDENEPEPLRARSEEASPVGVACDRLHPAASSRGCVVTARKRDATRWPPEPRAPDARACVLALPVAGDAVGRRAPEHAALERTPCMLRIQHSTPGRRRTARDGAAQACLGRATCRVGATMSAPKTCAYSEPVGPIKALMSGFGGGEQRSPQRARARCKRRRWTIMGCPVGAGGRQ
jgi:hypothetical protein